MSWIRRNQPILLSFQQRTYLQAWILQERFADKTCRLCKQPGTVESFRHLVHDCSIVRTEMHTWLDVWRLQLHPMVGNNARDLFWSLLLSIPHGSQQPVFEADPFPSY